MDDHRLRSRLLGTQVAALVLVSLLPVAWLIGRRTAPEATPVPILLGPGGASIALRSGPPGLADRLGPIELPPLPAGAGGYRLEFDLGGPDGDAHPPYLLQLTDPGGAVLWERTWKGPPPSAHAMADLVLPEDLMRSGRYNLTVQDAAGTIRMFPFLAP